MAQMRPDGVSGHVQLAGDLRPRQVCREIAQNSDLAVTQRLEQRLRPRGLRRRLASGEKADDVGDKGGVCAALHGVLAEIEALGLELLEVHRLSPA